MAVTIDVDAWCRRHLGAPVAEVLFTAGHLSRVWAVRLADGREVIVKARRDSSRLAACNLVQQTLWQAGFPAPEPLAGPFATDGIAVSAERLVPGGVLAPATSVATRFAGLLARLIRLAPPAALVASLAPDPPWVAWDHGQPGLWPAPDDRDVDLNTPEYATPWLDATGERARRRLRAFAETDAGQIVLIGHGDWEAQNLRWQGDEPLVVHDWDSIVSAPEAIIVGFAASVWPCGIQPRAATLPESAAFIDAYQRVAGRIWSRDEIEASWAAGLWVYAFNAKKASLDNVDWLAAGEADQRLQLSDA
jgi:hypothetical protein